MLLIEDEYVVAICKWRGFFLSDFWLLCFVVVVSARGLRSCRLSILRNVLSLSWVWIPMIPQMSN